MKPLISISSEETEMDLEIDIIGGWGQVAGQIMGGGEKDKLEDI